MWAMISDRLPELPGLIARSHELGTRARAGDADVEAAGQQMALAYRTGMLGQYAELIEAQIRDNPQLVVNLPVLALAHVQAGHREAGAAIFEQLAADDFAAIPRDMLWTGGMAVLAHVSVLLSDRERARRLYECCCPTASATS